MILAPMFFVYALISMTAWLAWIIFRRADNRKTSMRKFLYFLAVAYSFQAVANLVFPTPNRDNDPFFVRIHLFTWFAHFFTMNIALFHLTRTKKGRSLAEQQFAYITLVLSLTGIVATYILHLFRISNVPFRHLPGNLPEWIFVECYYITGAMFIFLTVKNLLGVALHEKLLVQRARSLFSLLSAFLGLIYYLIKVFFSTSAFLLNISSSNYLPLFEKIEAITLFLMIAVALSWAMVLLPSGVIIYFAIPLDFFRKIVLLFQLHDMLRQIHKPVKRVSFNVLRDLDLAIIEIVTKILDIRDLLLSAESVSPKYLTLLSIKDSSDIWEVIESCVTIRHNLKRGNEMA